MVIMDKSIFIERVLPRYFGAELLSLAISLTINVFNPKSAIIANRLVNDSANDKIPNPSAPK